MRERMSIKAIRICVKDSVKMRFECVECKIGRNGRWGIKGVINEVIKGEKKTFLFKGMKRFRLGIKMAILLTKLMYGRYKIF
ncbi:TPA: hypothetical protein ACJE8Y_001702 [Campylobacter jejuni]|uniref:Uncharacterized protein n=1 Tax=Campylobacter jejuni TaxID=197 RepID=A0A5Y4VNJ6_CAMJU|nr:MULTISPECIES: hypothetical protein [Campylobacter]EDP7437485.1 hypothetical protein [Campylobacter coli]QJE47432.1 hypothetical protein FBE87_09020 [Campylobacter sp. CFSAN093246]EAH4546684.1 hypothetical protein [Campylobacter jejuni]EAH6581670.1 hypothetical protein [Campylobacter jejuni]EAH8472142.1 hypothetical protein [Campylobacter jejuni]